MLKKITQWKDRVKDWTVYPFSVPTIASLTEIEIDSRVVFFAGENGTGKSTLLERLRRTMNLGRRVVNYNFDILSAN